jgi:hypothetical protein
MSKITKLLNTIAIALFACALTPALHAQTCSDQSLKGSFGYTVTGTITKNSGPLVAGPFVAVGRIVFDGKGNVSTVRAFNDNGTSLTNDAGTGTYTLNSDCTGTFNITVGPPTEELVLTLSIVLDDTYQLRGVVTTTNVVLAFEGRKQFPVNY